MNKAYKRINWENYPSDATPLNDANLNKIDAALDTVDNRVITLDTTKLDLITAQTMVKSVSFNEKNGVFTITYLNGATATIDTKMEKLAVNFIYDAESQRLIITLDDGTKQYVDLSALITQFEFLDSDTVTFYINGAGEIIADIKEGSIEEKHLRPNYLADIKVQAARAAASEAGASQSSTAAGVSEAKAADKASEASASADGAAVSAANASKSAAAASASAANASKSATAASTSEKKASQSESKALVHMEGAKQSETKAAANEQNAKNAALQAKQYAEDNEYYANSSKSFAVGTDGTFRENDNADNAKYYYEQARGISEGLQGALLPMGTITFEQLTSVIKLAGYMYNISNDFVTNAAFKEGAGFSYPAGTNVYYTADGYWDCLAGTLVAGVKGSAEQEYRKGYVNITSDNVGAVSKSEFQKALGNMDISGIGDGSVKGAIAGLNTDLAVEVNRAKVAESGINADLSTKQPASTAITTGNIGQQSVNYANSSGSASKLGSNAGTSTIPVYFSGGKPVQCSINPTVYSATYNGGCLATLINGINYTIPISSGSYYNVTRIGIEKNMTNGKRVLVIQWYADGVIYTNKITCD